MCAYPIRAALALLFSLVLGLSGAGATDQTGPAGEPVLIVGGEIGAHNGGGGEALFDLPMLEALGAAEFTTTTIWTEGEVTFEGVPLPTLLKALEVTDGTLELWALNDYLVEIPVAEALESPALIAYRINGETISPRGKGPLWLVYPYDSDIRLQTETYYSRSIWQMVRINVLDGG